MTICKLDPPPGVGPSGCASLLGPVRMQMCNLPKNAQLVDRAPIVLVDSMVENGVLASRDDLLQK